MIFYHLPNPKRNGKAMVTYLQYCIIKGLALVMDTREILASVNRFDNVISSLDDSSQQKLMGVVDLVEAIQTAERQKAEADVYGRLTRAEALLEVFYDWCLMKPEPNAPLELEAIRINEALRKTFRERIVAALEMKDIGEILGRDCVKPAHARRAKEAIVDA